MKTCRFPILIALLLIVMVSSVTHVTPVARAQALSAGCTELNNPIYDNYYGGQILPPLQYNSGERIIVSAAPPDTSPTFPVTGFLIWLNTSTFLFSTSYPGTITYTFTSNQTATVRWVPRPTFIEYKTTFQVSCDLASAGAKNTQLPLFTDGRCNQQAEQPVTIYSDRRGGYYFYAVHESVGHFALHLTRDDLAANPDTGENYLIAQAVGVQVYRLKGGKLQVKRLLPDGKSYDFIWPPCH